jgi:hypothetical protein
MWMLGVEIVMIVSIVCCVRRWWWLLLWRLLLLLLLLVVLLEVRSFALRIDVVKVVIIELLSRSFRACDCE